MFAQSREKSNYIGITGLNKDLVLSVAIDRMIKGSDFAQGCEDSFSEDSERPGFHDQGLSEIAPITKDSEVRSHITAICKPQLPLKPERLRFMTLEEVSGV